MFDRIENLLLPSKDFNFKTKVLLILALFVISFIILSTISLGVIQNFPNSADEYAYIFQARNLARFQLYAPIHPDGIDGNRLQSYFYFVHIGETENKYYGRFPFGYSLLMVPSAWLEMLFKIDTYWMVNVIFGCLTLLIVYLIAKKLFNRFVAIVAVIVTFTNPWFLFTSGSFFSHTTCAFFIGLSIYLLILAMEQDDVNNRRIKFLLSGLSFGYAILVRFLDPLAFILPLLLIYFFIQIKQKKLTWGKVLFDGIYFSIGVTTFLLVLIFYNKGLTGHFFLTAYRYYNPNDSGTRFIFMDHQDGKNIYDFSKIYKIGYLERTLPNINTLFGWYNWIYILIALPVAIFINRKNFNDLVYLLGFLLMTVIVIFFYTLYGGPPMNQYGPRYFYSFIIPVSILVAYTISHLGKNKVHRVILGMIILFTLIFPIRSIFDKEKEVSSNNFDRKNVYRTVKENNLHNSVVFLTTNSGSMYIGDLTRNGLYFKNDILYSQTLGGNYAPLMKYYPDRTFYEYRYVGKDKLGSLTKLIINKDFQFYREGKVADIDMSSYEMGEIVGLTGFYYNDENFNHLVFKNIDSIPSFDWKTGSPDPRINTDHFSIQWKGFIKADIPGEYTFVTLSDDGVKLYIENTLIIDNFTPHAKTGNIGKIILSQGWHPICLQYNDITFNALIRLTYQLPNDSNSIHIPKENLRALK